jgi:hypothetical protein
MSKEFTEKLRGRPYFGGEENKRQIRVLSEIKLYKNLILFNIYSGGSSLLHVVSYPAQINCSWISYFEEIGTCGRSSPAKRIDLSTVSVIPYSDGTWETEWCLLKTSARIFGMKVSISYYQPQHY